MQYANFCVHLLRSYYQHQPIVVLSTTTDQTYALYPGNENPGLEYSFISKGPRIIPKLIKYEISYSIKGLDYFNLGFGNYDVDTESIVDDVTDANGDARKVLKTVLSTIPLFFLAYPNAAISIRGSDSTPEFVVKCKASCKRNCGGQCRKANRRLSLYQRELERNFLEYSNSYQFQGGFIHSGFPFLQDFVPGNKYDIIVVTKIFR